MKGIFKQTPNQGRKRILVAVLLLLLLAGYGYHQYNENTLPETPTTMDDDSELEPIPANEDEQIAQPPASSDNKQCDGRTACKQMTSCAEATFFLNNCPNTKRMDANKNGVPCEKQWCNQ